MEPINALPIFSLKANTIRSLESLNKAAYEAAMTAGKWNDIINASNPTAELEIFCISQVIDKEYKREDAIALLKEVKKHLINLNTTVLVAYEKRTLQKAMEHVLYHGEHFKPQRNWEQPSAEEVGWEDRVEKADKVIRKLQRNQED